MYPTKLQSLDRSLRGVYFPLSDVNWHLFWASIVSFIFEYQLYIFSCQQIKNIAFTIREIQLEDVQFVFFQVLNGWKIKYIWKHKSSAIFPWTCQQINHIHVYTRPFKKFLKRLWTWLDRTPLEPGRFCSVPSVSGLIRFSVVACIIRLYVWSLVSNYSLYIIWLATCAIMHNVIILYMDKEVWKMIKH